ncbi:GNAT family N-acetyltransferase [Sediminihaliea albiluteola]|uniref:GNAT family N-acetyltransferase n=1 Tax=Sediminihaliea albiluteola TaxID=2758564 RepID=UPI001C713C96|nr:GNAT family N-acetyltransferase [Sediminihaliea albiluteola]
MTKQAGYSIEFISSLSQVEAGQWQAVVGDDYPFLRYEFLYGLESSGCTTAKTGWQPCHALLRKDSNLCAVLPLYLKSHSYGEYVFDWAWADAWQRLGLDYYPKLLSAIPFTPASGPRLRCSAAITEDQAWPIFIQAIKDLAQERGLSSWHLLFPEPATSQKLQSLGLPQRLATQFHWLNQNYQSFDDFLATFSSRKRKSLRRERARVSEQGLKLQRLQGTQISPKLWQQFHRFYQLTYAKRSGHGGYLSREFFTEVAPSLGEQVLMVVAELNGETVAAALYFHSGDTLYGRYWGCEQEFDCLHFEACYYQGIEYCIERGLKRFDPGAQGEHKIQRGFTPILTYSNHWVAEPELAAAVADFTRREAVQVEHYRQQAAELLPFKRGSN